VVVVVGVGADVVVCAVGALVVSGLLLHAAPAAARISGSAMARHVFTSVPWLTCPATNRSPAGAFTPTGP